MRRYLLSVPAMIAAALVLGHPASAQEKEIDEKIEKKEKAEKAEKKEKAEKAEKDEKVKISNEEIVIKRKNNKDGKVTIELKGDDIIVNGKPLEDYDDDDIVISKRKSVSTYKASPFRSQGGTYYFDNDSNFGLAESNTPFLGVVTEKDGHGAKIEEITEGSAADKAGLKEGDVIMKVGEDKIENPEDLTKAVRKHKPEDKVGITYERGGKAEKTTVTLGKRNRFALATPKYRTMPDMNFSMPDMNFNWDNGNQNWARTGKPRLGIKAQDTEDGKGVKVLDVDEESPAEKAGIKEDDIITEFDGKKVDNADELAREAHLAQAAQKSSIKITFNRNGKSQTVEVKTPRKLKTTNL